eukprot:CAMPEP_0174257134 /NCGR_PEP_ID=MMETSP0439-20130205/6301_1 /TAXON_ID=0 /ORGANISM="Stereomyxa ramosa, Strain Chinc5" /LENGTH=137 /DNA_ID=CAMNT_0015340075 /DNA_START=565 /DNA_END=978 /DNA_ORIENTATION=-
MKLQRKALHASKALQLPSPDVHVVEGKYIHVIFDKDDNPLFIKKQMCTLLDMKGTTFSYWKKKSGVEEIDTSLDFRLMDTCRKIYGGRATYTLYSAQSAHLILEAMVNSRQKGICESKPLRKLMKIVAKYPHGQDQE